MGIGKSFRESNKKKLIEIGQNDYILMCNARSKTGVVNIRTEFKNKSYFKISDKKCHLSDLQKHYAPIFFSADFCNLILNSSSYRRKFFDRLIFGIDSLYLPLLLRYNHVVKQKNQLLKTYCNTRDLESWNFVLCDMIVSLTRYRQGLVDCINQILCNRFGDVVAVSFSPTISVEMIGSAEQVFRFLMTNLYHEKKYKTSLFGPHRDKFLILYKNKTNLLMNSSGEIKIFMFFLYLSYFDYFFSVRNEFPVLLIDDFDAALDADNKRLLLNYADKMQVIASSVNRFNDFDCAIHLEKENKIVTGK